LDADRFYGFDQAQVAFTDQLVFRFGKLQDTMGSKLFPITLECLFEQPDGLSAIDMLNRLEKLELLDSTLQWRKFREARNIISHEYPANLDERLNALNQTYSYVSELENIFLNITATLQKQGWQVTPNTN
jgi:hypothetical protein